MSKANDADNYTMHLIIPFASTHTESGQLALDRLQLPYLQALLPLLTLVDRDEGDDFTLTPPHERCIAQLHGWQSSGDGQWPWAAQRAQQAGIETGSDVWGMFTPTHWHVAAEHVTMINPDQLDLTEPESRALFDTIAPLFIEDGWRLIWQGPTTWLVSHPSLSSLPTASLDRVIGRNPDVWLPDHPSARALRRLQSEVQMAWYQHPVNEQREAQGQLPVNTIWLSGCGVFQATQPHGAQVLDALRTPMLDQRWDLWLAAWEHLDQTMLQSALAHVKSQQSFTLELCGERHAHRYVNAPMPWWRRWFPPRPLTSAKNALSAL